ncbi:SDR family oxidoreductase, partial [Mycobacterium sp.]|uniref:SDR family NAD(P)-dependent oxidoreductase n=1 Tax=Mycobacterium sp. TaxID=1785 RepID=UPI0031D0CAD2
MIDSGRGCLDTVPVRPPLEHERVGHDRFRPIRQASGGVGCGLPPGARGPRLVHVVGLGRGGSRGGCIDIDERRAEHIAGRGGTAVPIVVDMTDPTQVGRAIDDTVAALSGVDVCVNIIGDATWSKVEDFPNQLWDEAIHCNLTQVFYLFQAAARYMIAQGSGGSLVALASVDSFASATYHAAYGAAKAGVISLVETFADELSRYGVRANAIAPGNVRSGNEDQPPNEYDVNGIDRVAAPRAHDVANAALFPSCELAARITSQTLVVDGDATIRQLWGLPASMIPPNRDEAMLVGPRNNAPPGSSRTTVGH